MFFSLILFIDLVLLGAAAACLVLLNQTWPSRRAVGQGANWDGILCILYNEFLKPVGFGHNKLWCPRPWIVSMWPLLCCDFWLQWTSTDKNHIIGNTICHRIDNLSNLHSTQCPAMLVPDSYCFGYGKQEIDH